MKIPVFVFVALSTVTACGHSSVGPDLWTDHGFAVFYDSAFISKEDIEAQTDAVISAMEIVDRDHFPPKRIERLLAVSWIELHLTDYEIKCTTKDYGAIEVPGCTWFTSHGAIISVFKNNQCVALTALAHELVHAIAYLVEGDPDADHDDPRFFPSGCPEDDVNCPRNTAEVLAEWAGCEMTCSDLCLGAE